MKFKVGDKVIAIAEVGKKCIKNVTGKIIAIDEHSIPYLVEFDEDINGHDGFGKGKPGHCWWVREYEISPIFVHQKIVITSDGHTTTAKLYDGKTVVKSAEAKCHPDDPFDFTIGANLAYERLMCKPEPEYYNGKVVCIKAGSYHTAGKVYEVKNGVVNCDYDDSGEFTYNIITPVKTLEQLNANGPVQFIEFKGEVNA